MDGRTEANVDDESDNSFEFAEAFFQGLNRPLSLQREREKDALQAKLNHVHVPKLAVATRNASHPGTYTLDLQILSPRRSS